MSVAPSRSLGHSQAPPSRAVPSGSMASVHIHRSVRSHHSTALEEAATSSPSARFVISERAVTVVPSDSVSQIGERPADRHWTTASHLSHAYRNHSLPPSHLSQVSDASSQRLTEANLHVHDVEAQSSHHSGAPVELDVEVQVLEEPTPRSHASHHTVTRAQPHHAPTLHPASVASSHKTPTVVPNSHHSVAASQSGSNSPSAVPSHCRSTSHPPLSKPRTIVGSQVHSSTPTSNPLEEAVPSKAPTTAPLDVGSAAPSKALSHAGSAAQSQAGSKGPTSVPPDHHSTAPASQISPEELTTIEISPGSPSTPAEKGVFRDLIPIHSRSGSGRVSPTNGVNVVQVRRAHDQIIETEYKIQRRHVYPVKA